jgi:hypothetical protein
MKLQLILTGLWVAFMPIVQAADADSLRKGFQSPPNEVRTRVWWHWMGTNISRQGVARDLEAIKQAGLGGATILGLPDMVGNWDTFDIQNSPWPTHTMFSDQWYDLVAFAASESGRLGLSLSLHNCAGYSTSGGPWITPEQSMQRLIYTKVEVSGTTGQKMTLTQPKIPSTGGGFDSQAPWDVSAFYRDVAVIAVPKGQDENGLLIFRML